MRLFLLWLLLLFASSAWAKERVVIIDLSSSTSLPPELVQGFRKSMIKGLEGAGFEVVSQKELEEALKAHPELVNCQDLACLKTLGSLLKASRVIDGRVVSEGNNYSFTLRLIDLARNQVTPQENSCDVCSVSEAAETLSITAASLLGKAIEATPPKVTRVFIESRPAGAQVLSGGKPLGQTPLIAELPQGEYELVFRLEGYNNFNRTIALRGEDSVNVTADMNQRLLVKLSTDKGALWGGVVVGGLMVVGGTALAVRADEVGGKAAGGAVGVVGLGLTGLSVYYLKKAYQKSK